MAFYWHSKLKSVLVGIGKPVAVVKSILHHCREAYRVFTAHCNSEELINAFGLYLVSFAVLARNTLLIRSFRDDVIFTNENERSPESALRMIHSEKNVQRIMNGYNNQIRSQYVLFALDRILEKAFEHECSARPIERDIRPCFATLADGLSACVKILYTPMPWIYTVHLRFMMFIFLCSMPLTLLDARGLYMNVKISWYGILFYVLVTSYAFLGLEDMAIEIRTRLGLITATYHWIIL